MKCTILGGFKFTSQKGNEMFNLTVDNARKSDTVIGSVYENYYVNPSDMPSDLKNIIGKTYQVDKNSRFLSDFYEVK